MEKRKSLNLFHDGDIVCVYHEGRPNSFTRSSVDEINRALDIVNSVIDLCGHLDPNSVSTLSEVYIDVETMTDDEDGKLVVQIADESFVCYPIWTITEGVSENEVIHDSSKEIMEKIVSLLNNNISLADTLLDIDDADFRINVY